jgi:hypothetical protein
MENKGTHFYILPDGTIVENQLQGREILGIGRNAFRNRVKNGSIQKITNKPQGYGQEQEDLSNQC